MHTFTISNSQLRNALLCLILVCFTSAQVRTTQAASIMAFGDAWTHPQDVADGGSVVTGLSSNPSSPGGWRWTSSEGFTPLSDLPGGTSDYSWVKAISADATVIVGRGDGVNGPEAFRWTAATGIQGLGDLPGSAFQSFAYDVSGNGAVVVGEGKSSSGTEAFLWTQSGGMIGLGDFPGGFFHSTARGVSGGGDFVVGSGSTVSGQIAYRWSSSTGMHAIGDLPGGTEFSLAYAVSDNGDTVVGESAGANGAEAFLWTSQEGIVGLGDLPGGAYASRAFGVSADGSLILGQATTANGPVNFLWTKQTGMVSLNDVLTAAGLDLSDWLTISGSAISRDGRYIVGTGHHIAYGNTRGFIIDLQPSTSVPDGGPTLRLLLVGLVGVAWVRWGVRLRESAKICALLRTPHSNRLAPGAIWSSALTPEELELLKSADKLPFRHQLQFQTTEGLSGPLALPGYIPLHGRPPSRRLVQALFPKRPSQFETPQRHIYT